MLPRHARCVLCRLRCNGHSLLLGSYLSRFGRIENPSCSACGHSSQHISPLIIHCPATDSLRRSLFGDSVSLRPLVQTLGLHGLPQCPHPWEGVGKPTTTTTEAAGQMVKRCEKIKFKLDYKLATKVFG